MTFRQVQLTKVNDEILSFSRNQLFETKIVFIEDRNGNKNTFCFDVANLNTHSEISSDELYLHVN